MSRARTNPWLVLVVLCTGFFMILLDTTIVNVAIPAMLSALNTTLDQILWVLNAYILVYAVLLITAGRLGDLYGQRNLFAIGLAIFIFASALCGISQNVDALIAARILQGVGGAVLTPQTLAIITSLFPPERRGAAFGVWGAVAGLATVTGPTLGGALVTYIDWRWIFYVNVPIGIAAFIATFAIIPDLRPGRHHGWDVIGVILATTGLFAVVFGLIEGQRYNWGEISSYVINIPEVIGIGVGLLAVFIVWERYQTEPLVPLSLFADRNFAVANWVAAAVGFALLGLFFPITIYLQSVRGFSALTAGLTLAPMSVTSMFVAPFAGRLSDRIGAKYILMTGLSLFTIGIGTLIYIAGPDSTWVNFLAPAIVMGAGMGMTFAPMTTVAMRNISPRMAGAASGVMNTMRQLGAAVGSAVIGAVLQSRLATSLHDQAVTQSTFLPPEFRGQFVAAFNSVAANGFQVGQGQNGAQLPAGLPPSVVQQISSLAHSVFVSGYIDAMKPTLVVPIVALSLTAVATVLIKRPPIGQKGESAADNRRGDSAIATIPVVAQAGVDGRGPGVAVPTATATAFAGLTNGEVQPLVGASPATNGAAALVDLSRVLGAAPVPRPLESIPLPPSSDPLPALAAELVRVELLVRRLESGVLEFSDNGRRGLLCVADREVRSAWLSEDGREVCGEEAQRELLDWRAGTIEARILTAEQAEAISWLWSLPELCRSMPLDWIQAGKALDQLRAMPGRLAVWLQIPEEPAVALFSDGRVVMAFSSRRPALGPDDFGSLMQRPGTLNIRWSKASPSPSLQLAAAPAMDAES
jgi:EmrB/QacA subfamily drug resistance transporter